MTAPATIAPAARALEALLEELELAGITASRDSGAFYPQPIGVLVGLPTLVSRGLATRTFTVPVLVVSGDPLNTTLAVDRLFALADDVALALSINAYRPSSHGSGVNAEPLPAVELQATITIIESEVSHDG